MKKKRAKISVTSRYANLPSFSYHRAHVHVDFFCGLRSPFQFKLLLLQLIVILLKHLCGVVFVVRFLYHLWSFTDKASFVFFGYLFFILCIFLAFCCPSVFSGTVTLGRDHLSTFIFPYSKFLLRCFSMNTKVQCALVNFSAYNIRTT